MLIVHDNRIPEEYMIALEEKCPSARFLSFRGISSEKEVYRSIKSHPDIYLFQLDAKTIVHAPGIDSSFLNELSRCGVDLIAGREDPSGKYPHTAKYNAVRVGDNVFLNEAYCDPMVIKAVKQKRLNIIHIQQGYSRCSIFPVSCDAIITSDEIAHRAALNAGMASLLIKPGNIMLPGENYGFIGGCCGVSCEHKLFVLGDLLKHEQGKDIIDFVLCHNDGIFTLKGLRLYDAGSLLIV